MNINCTTGFGLPGPGDITICVYCQTVLQFQHDMSFEIFMAFDELTEEQRLQVMTAIEFFQRVMNRSVH